MACSGTDICNIIDVVIWIMEFINSTCCPSCCTLPFMFTILPSFAVDAVIDYLGLAIMMMADCVYRQPDGEYVVGGEEYIFSFNPASFINYCNLTEASLRNLTEVTHHQDFLYAVVAWCAAVSWFFPVCLFPYIGICYGAIKACLSREYKLNRKSFELNGTIFVIIFGIMKTINFYAVMVMVLKGCFVMHYVTPSPLEIVVFILSLIDICFIIKEYNELRWIWSNCESEAQIRQHMHKACCCDTVKRRQTSPV